MNREPDLGVDAVVEQDEREERENADADEIRPVSTEDDVPAKERKGAREITLVSDIVSDYHPVTNIGYCDFFAIRFCSWPVLVVVTYSHIRYLTYCTIKNTRIDDKVHATIGPQLMTR